MKPVNLSRHGTQLFYLKAKGAVYFAYQLRAVMNAPSEKGCWKEKLFTHLFNILAIKGFIEWIVVACDEFMKTPELFVSLKSF